MGGRGASSGRTRKPANIGAATGELKVGGATQAKASPKPKDKAPATGKVRVTQAKAMEAAEASFSKSSWWVDDVRERNGNWTIFTSKKAYGDGYEARGEVKGGKIVNDEMGMGERALDFARKTGAKNVTVIGYAD